MAKKKRGMTSGDFIRTIEAGGISDDMIIGMNQKEFENTIRRNDKVADFTKDLKRGGFSEFSNGWASRMLVDMNKVAEEKMGLMEMLRHIAEEEREESKLNKMIKARGNKDLRYIA